MAGSAGLAGAGGKGGNGGDVPVGSTTSRGKRGEDGSFGVNGINGRVGNGGAGGTAINISADGVTLLNQGKVLGGTPGSINAQPGEAIVVSGKNSHIINDIGGEIRSSGLNSKAVEYEAGADNGIFEMRTNSIVDGVVDATKISNGKLLLGGNTAKENSTFIASKIGNGRQYQGFSNYEVNTSEGSTWNLIGETTALTPWTVTGGTLAIVSDHSLGATDGALTLNGGVLQTVLNVNSDRRFNLTAESLNGGILTDGDLTLTNVISGVGGLKKTGNATLILGGQNDYTGRTIISSGNLFLTGEGGIEHSESVELSKGTSLNISSTTGGTMVNNLTGDEGSHVVLGDRLLTVNSLADSVFSGEFGAEGETGGLLKTGAASFTLAGQNNYTGDTTVSAGKLSLSGDSNIEKSGNVRLNRDAALDISATTNGTMANNLTGDEGSHVVLGDRLLTVNSLADSVFSGEFGAEGETGGLLKTGAASFTLAGQNNYTGDTTVSAGKLSLSGDSNIEKSGNVRLNRDATLDISATTNGTMVNNLTGDEGSHVVLGDRLLTVNSLADSVFSGEISGNGSLIKKGQGDMTLDGINSYQGITRIDQGNLRINSDQSLGGGNKNNSHLIMNGGGLKIFGSFASDRDVYFNADGEISVDKDMSSSWNKIHTGDYKFTKSGEGELIVRNGGDASEISLMNGALTLINLNMNSEKQDALLNVNNGVLNMIGGDVSAKNDLIHITGDSTINLENVSIKSSGNGMRLSDNVQSTLSLRNQYTDMPILVEGKNSILNINAGDNTTLASNMHKSDESTINLNLMNNSSNWVISQRTDVDNVRNSGNIIFSPLNK
ncbi:autotransporter-associated beta strand repeat-containing protein, partial [Salmonella enterica]|nr:autotransporter-associated beta strand repeat-containing protein [Salmonella enterica]